MRTMRRRTRTITLIGVGVGLALIVAGCGSDSDSGSDSGSGSGSPVPTEAPPGESVLPTPPAVTEVDAVGSADVDVPSRVVSLSPTATEMMFAIGAGDLLVAIDDQSNYPPEALERPNELSGFEPNVEAIAGYEPDLVLIGGDFTGLGAQLDELGIPWWDGPAATTLDDTYAQIEQLGAATGNIAQAAELVAQMQTDIDQLVADTPVPEQPLSIYHELDPTLYSADSSTFIGEIYSLLGLQNIADQAEGDSGGFPQLNAESIVSADPDLIFLADTKCCGEMAATVAARPGWDAIAAVQNGNVFEMDDDVASRWGPRIVEYLASVSAAVQQAVVPA